MGLYYPDADGKEFLALIDQYNLHCGLSVKDPRKVVRIANIDRSLLTTGYTTGARIQMLMIDALNRIEGLDSPGHKAAWFMDRNTISFLERQLVSDKNAHLGYENVEGKRIVSFGGVPVKRLDALRVNEATVV